MKILMHRIIIPIISWYTPIYSKKLADKETVHSFSNKRQ